MDAEKLIEKAKIARENAYAPYSKYYVGAALLCKNGKVYTGCNVENHGIMSICAERVAFAKAISEGEKEFECLAIYGGKDEQSAEHTPPCGYCRQFMSEFVNKDFKIYVGNSKGEIVTYNMKELLPYSFEIKS